MVRIYGTSDSEREFLEYLNSFMLEIKLVSLDDYQNFQKYPEKRKNDILTTFDSQIENAKSNQTKCYNENGFILNDLKRINSQIFYKEKSVNKYWGELREKIKRELSSLKDEKRDLESEFESNNKKITNLKSEIQDLYSTKKTTLFNVDKDIPKIIAINNDQHFKNLRQGSFGERNVITHVQGLFKDNKNYHLINAFDINLLGKAINVDNHTLTETKLDHILLCPLGLFILETKAWKNYSKESVNKIINQLQKIKISFQDTFKDKINQDFIKIFLVCTEQYIPLKENEHFRSIKLADLKSELNKSKEILSNDEITLILNHFLPHLNSDHITTGGKMNIKLKTMFVKTKRFIKDKLNNNQN